MHDDTIRTAVRNATAPQLPDPTSLPPQPIFEQLADQWLTGDAPQADRQGWAAVLASIGRLANHTKVQVGVSESAADDLAALPRHLWRTVRFEAGTPTDKALIVEEARLLRQMGIFFGVDLGLDCVVWRVDHSFRVGEPEQAVAKKKSDGVPLLGAPGLVIPSRLGMIAEIKAVNGMVKVRQHDGREQIWAPGECAARVQECQDMLRSMGEAELRGARIPESARKTTMELIDKVTAAVLQARHQMESVQRYDRETQGVKRTLTRLDQQRGLAPGLSEDDIPDEQQIEYYGRMFEYMKDFEIIAVLRATDIPIEGRKKMLAYMNGKRMVEAQQITEQDLDALMRSGTMKSMQERTGVKA